MRPRILHLHFEQRPICGSCQALRQLLGQEHVDVPVSAWLGTRPSADNLLSQQASLLNKALMWEFIQQNMPANRGHILQFPEQKEALFETLKQWAMAGISFFHVERLRRSLSREAGSHGIDQKIDVLLSALDTYKKWGHDDSAWVVNDAVQTWRHHKPNGIHEADILYIDALDLLTQKSYPLGVGLIRMLAALAEPPHAKTVRILMPDTLSSQTLESAWDSLLTQLHRHHTSNMEEERFPIEMASPHHERDSFFNNLHVFRNKKDATSDQPWLRVLNPISNSDEARWIEHTITTWHNQGISLEEMAVVAEHPLRQRMILDHLQQAGLPAYAPTTWADEMQEERSTLFGLPTLLEPLFPTPDGDPLKEGSFSEHAESCMMGIKNLQNWVHPAGSTTLPAWMGGDALKNKLAALEGMRKQGWEHLRAWLSLTAPHALAKKIRGTFSAFKGWMIQNACQTLSRNSRGQGVWIGSANSLLHHARPSYLVIAGMVDNEASTRLNPPSFFTEEEEQKINAFFKKTLFSSKTNQNALQQVVTIHALAQCASAVLSIPFIQQNGQRSRPSDLASRICAHLGHDFEQFESQHKPIGPDPIDPMTISRVQHAIDVEKKRQLFFEKSSALRIETTPSANTNIREDIHPFCGELTPFLSPPMKAHLAHLGSYEKPISVSNLEDAAQCPFRFFAKSVLQLKPPAREKMDVDGLVLGSLYHDILKSFFESMRDENCFPLRWDKKAEAVLDQKIRDRCAQIEHPTWQKNPNIQTLHQQRIQNDLAWLIQQEETHPLFQETTPLCFEFRAPRIAVAYNDHQPVYLSGVLDRIDAGQNRLVLFDYKLGFLDHYETVLKQELGTSSFQLPAYLLALKQDPLFSEKNKNIQAYYYSIKEGRPSKHFVDASQSYNASMYKVVESIRQGRFGIQPQTCAHCDFQSICRIPRIAQEKT